jgi:hypothetical protein
MVTVGVDAGVASDPFLHEFARIPRIIPNPKMKNRLFMPAIKLLPGILLRNNTFV